MIMRASVFLATGFFPVCSHPIAPAYNGRAICKGGGRLSVAWAGFRALGARGGRKLEGRGGRGG